MNIRNIGLVNLIILTASPSYAQEGPSWPLLDENGEIIFPQKTSDELEWQNIQAASKAVAGFRVPQTDEDEETQLRSINEFKTQRSNERKGVADQAKDFYVRNPNSRFVGAARNLEILSLVSAIADGDRGVQGRLVAAAAALRSDRSIPEDSRAIGLAAFEFSEIERGARTHSDVLAAVEAKAREFKSEFPNQPQAYEALHAVARSSSTAKSLQIAQELVTSSAPQWIKDNARKLIDREELVGTSVFELIPEIDRKRFSEGKPILLYSWDPDGPGSIRLGKMIQARRFDAIGICLDDNLKRAALVQSSEGLGGTHIYRDKGFRSDLVNALAIMYPGQVYIIDSEGVLRDIRGDEGFEEKLKEYGFSTPILEEPILDLS
jgi:hypothetical protein